MVPAFRLVVKRQRHDQLITVFLSGTDCSSFNSFSLASLSAPFPVPRCVRRKEGRQRLVACIAHGLRSEVRRGRRARRGNERSKPCLRPARDWEVCGPTGLMIELHAVFFEHPVVRHDLLIAAGALLPLVSAPPCIEKHRPASSSGFRGNTKDVLLRLDLFELTLSPMGRRWEGQRGSIVNMSSVATGLVRFGPSCISSSSRPGRPTCNALCAYHEP